MVAQPIIPIDLLETVKKVTQPLMKYPFVKGIMLYGSHVKGTASVRSDIDIAIIAPKIPDKIKFLYEVLKILHSPPYDAKLFENLPLFIQIDILEHHILLHAKSELDLYEYLRHYHILWKDQVHRQHLTNKEIMEMVQY